MYSFIGDNPTRMYYDAVEKLVREGDEVSPRGKLVKELRPTLVEFLNPYNRVTFLGSRRINPFFQLAESLWILSGRADVEWLTKFNANMASFSDDGVYFNAPYGERIRSWNKNAAHNVIINPIDQLVDAYIKLLNDKDTRQVVVLISNPMFDNSKYTIGERGKDIACNLLFMFKVRHNKLEMTVVNRSNDAHWGLWGANLCQFSTIQEVMLNWLKNSGEEDFEDLEIGTYCQFTDSLHIYLDDYGAKCTSEIAEYYKKNPVEDVDADFSCVSEPRMHLNQQQFDEFLSVYWNTVDVYLMDDDYIVNDCNRQSLIDLIDDYHKHEVIDDYWTFAIKAMLSYRLVKLGKLQAAMEVMDTLEECQWKISMLYFLKTFIHKLGKDESKTEEFRTVVELYNNSVNKFASEPFLSENCKSILVDKYLSL